MIASPPYQGHPMEPQDRDESLLSLFQYETERGNYNNNLNFRTTLRRSPSKSTRLDYKGGRHKNN